MLTDYLLTDASFTGQDIEGLDDDPLLTPAELKERFDSAAKDVLMPAHNGIINTLAATSNQNLLHNWDFTSPINQRGQGSYAGAGYGLDRWVATASGALVTVNGGYVTLSASGEMGFYQYLERDFAGKTVTLSVQLLNGTIETLTGVVPATGNINKTMANGTSMMYVHGGVSRGGLTVSDVQLYVTSAASLSIRRMKLELGAVSTLENDAFGDYAEQFEICRRFYLPIAQAGHCGYINAGATEATILIPTPVTLRVNPSFATGMNFTVRCGSDFAVAPANQTIAKDGANGIKMTLAGTFTGKGSQVCSGFFASAGQALTAEL